MPDSDYIETKQLGGVSVAQLAVPTKSSDQITTKFAYKNLSASHIFKDTS